MFTKYQFKPPTMPQEPGEDIRSAFAAFLKNDYEFKRGLYRYLASLNNPGALSIANASIDATPIGATSASTGKFTTLEATGNTTLGDAAGDSVAVNGATFDYAAVATRIKGDFSNATVASRVLVQDRTTNQGTSFGVIPNGSSNAVHIVGYSASDPDNAHFLRFELAAASAKLNSSKNGSGTTRALEFQIDSTTKLTIGTDGNLTAAGVAAVGGAAVSASTGLNTPVGTTGLSSLRIPHGVAPTAPVNGDVWTTTAGLFVRVNGVTVGPLS